MFLILMHILRIIMYITFDKNIYASFISVSYYSQLFINLNNNPQLLYILYIVISNIKQLYKKKHILSQSINFETSFLKINYYYYI